VDAGPYAARPWSAAPNCRPGVVTAYVPLGKKTSTASKATVCWPAPPNWASAATTRHHRTGIAVGAPIPGCAPDSVIEIDNKSITHRPDLWGHHGMAREVAALLGRKLKNPCGSSCCRKGRPRSTSKLRISTFARGIKRAGFRKRPRTAFALVAPIPAHAIGLNPINNIVDMTTTSWPSWRSHARLRCRFAPGRHHLHPPRKPGERFRALNEEEYTLDSSNLVIADSSGAIALGA